MLINCYDWFWLVARHVVLLLIELQTASSNVTSPPRVNSVATIQLSCWFKGLQWAFFSNEVDKSIVSDGLFRHGMVEIISSKEKQHFNIPDRYLHQVDQHSSNTRVASVEEIFGTRWAKDMGGWCKPLAKAETILVSDVPIICYCCAPWICDSHSCTTSVKRIEHDEWKVWGSGAQAYTSMTKNTFDITAFASVFLSLLTYPLSTYNICLWLLLLLLVNGRQGLLNVDATLVITSHHVAFLHFMHQMGAHSERAHQLLQLKINSNIIK